MIVVPGPKPSTFAAKYSADYREYPGRCHFLSASSDVMQDVGAWVMEKVPR